MLIIFIRAVATFITLLVVMRLMGKRQIGEMQPFEFVLTLLIADLACIPMSDISVPLIYGIAAISAVFILHQLLSILEQSSQFSKRIISGKPSLVITKDGINFQELRNNNLDLEDLIESMRAGGYYSLDDLDYAIFESNGKLSAKEKADYADKKPSLPLLVISEGKIIHENADNVGLSVEEIKEIVRKHGAKNIKHVGVMTIDENGKVYFQTEKSRYETFTVDIKRGTQWQNL